MKDVGSGWTIRDESKQELPCMDQLVLCSVKQHGSARQNRKNAWSG